MNVTEPTTLEEQLVEDLADAHSIEEQALQQLRTAPKVAADAEPARLFEETTVAACEHMVEEERAANAKLERLFDRAVESSPAAVVGS